jgi:hypothetical protein
VDSTIENINIAGNNNGTSKQMDPQHQNNMFIDRKQCSLASLRGKPLAEKSYITKILKTRPSYTFYSYLY